MDMAKGKKAKERQVANDVYKSVLARYEGVKVQLGTSKIASSILKQHFTGSFVIQAKKPLATVGERPNKANSDPEASMTGSLAGAPAAAGRLARMPMRSRRLPSAS